MGKTIRDCMNAPRPLLTGLLSQVCPRRPLRPAPGWSPQHGHPRRYTYTAITLQPRWRAPKGLSPMAPFQGASGDLCKPTSSAYTLLWARGWCTKPLINALETQQGAEGE